MIALNAAPMRMLAILQEDATLTVNQLAERVGMSPSACRSWLQRLVDKGFIERRVAVLDRQTLGLGLAVFVTVKTKHADAAWQEAFERLTASPSVTECHRLSGAADYLIKAILRDIAAYEDFHRDYFSTTPLDATFRFALDQVKYTTALPLGEW